MTFTHSLRSLAAMALAAGLVLPVAASAAGPGGNSGGHHTPTAGSSQRPSSSRHKVSGTLTGMTGTTVPATLTVLSNSTTITVSVSAKTTLRRSHGGRSRLGEFTQGDSITADGSFAQGSTTTFDARSIKDLSIAYAHVVGSVAGMWTSDVTGTGGVTLLPAGRGSPHSPYWRGELVNVTLSPSTKVISGSVTLTGAVKWAQVPALHVQVSGLYDTANRRLPTLLANRVRILGTPGRPHPVAKPTP